MFKINSMTATGKRSVLFTFFALFLFFLNIPTASAQYAATDFLVADYMNGRIAVYDQNFVFQRYLDNNFPNVCGLDILANGSLVAVSQNQTVRTYNRAGTILTEFTDANLGFPMEIKAGTSNMFYIGTQDSSYSAAEFTGGGTYIRSFAAKTYDAIAVLPGGVLWAGGESQPGIIDVYDIQSGNLLSTITLDNGQIAAESMQYNSVTNTVLTTEGPMFGYAPQDSAAVVYERATNGAYIRTFYSPDPASGYFGVTRGPNGDVYAADTYMNKIHHWNAAGTYLGGIDISLNAFLPMNVVWAGNFLAPSAAGVSVAGRVTDSFGAGVTGATVSLTDPDGRVLTRRTNNFGAFRFDEIPAGRAYVAGVAARGLRYEPRVVTPANDLDDLDFSPVSGGTVRKPVR
ncbi:MAG: carboxypeptidase regulatory-like domain-containing protein [Acidobacteria bacterium]|nr:carboxypeptidase regulatory-like domain-containing protein [Acidobacteriota bacterium]